MDSGECSYLRSLYNEHQRCYACGYDLRGSSSPRCPECGLPVSIAIVIDDAQQFHLAKAALEREGLLVKHIGPGGSLGTLGTMYGLGFSAGWLWVDATRLEDVEHHLSEIGIAYAFNARPIVDRSEPVCPYCNAALDLDGPEQCATCNHPFQWVDVNQSQFDVDRTGQLCEKCGYELTGSESDQCPECGYSVLSSLVPGLPETSDVHAEESQPSPPTSISPAVRLLSVVFIGFAITLPIVFWKFTKRELPAQFAAVFAVSFLIYVLIFLLHLRRVGRH